MPQLIFNHLQQFTTVPRVRTSLALLLCLSLAACVTTGGPPKRAPARDDTANLQLNQLSLSLPGRYGNFHQFHQQERKPSTGSKLPLLQLHIQTNQDLTDRVDFIVEQSTPEQPASTRAFQWRLLATNNRLILRIVPRDHAGARPCDVILQAVSGGYAGQSDPRLCTVESEQGPLLGIRKEVAITAGAITLADQVVDLATGKARFETVLEFQRISEFKGWAGVKSETGQWQLARGFALHNDGDQISLVDPQGHSLGVRLQLARVSYREDRPAILRLAIYREAGSSAGETADLAPVAEDAAPQLLAYSWAEPNATQIGLNLDWFQVGLELSPPHRN